MNRTVSKLPELRKQPRSSLGQQPLFAGDCQLCGREEVNHVNAETPFGQRDVCTRCLRKYGGKRRSK